LKNLLFIIREIKNQTTVLVGGLASGSLSLRLGESWVLGAEYLTPGYELPTSNFKLIASNNNVFWFLPHPS